MLLCSYGVCKKDQPGYSILIKFTSLYVVERYIEEVYHIAGRAYVPYFQVRFITMKIDNIDVLAVFFFADCCQKYKETVKRLGETKKAQQTSKKESNDRMTHMHSSEVQ